MIIRSHQCVTLGYEHFAYGRGFTVFSAANYLGKHQNSGALVDVSADLIITPRVLSLESLATLPFAS